MCSKMPQLTMAERNKINKLVRHDKKTAKHAFRKINEGRAKRSPQVNPISYPAVCRFVAGTTHEPGRKETRGRPRSYTGSELKKALKARRKIIQEVDSEERITYEDIMEAAGLHDKSCVKTVATECRKLGISYRPPRRKIQLSPDDVKKRKVVAQEYAKKPQSFWRESVHG